MNLKFECSNFKLDDQKPLGFLLKQNFITDFHQALDWVFKLPYKRISDLEDLKLVYLEKRGTCSSKHAFLAKLAHENSHHEIQLELGYFEFSQENILSFKNFFLEIGSPYILEAHCYLRSEGKFIDVTSNKFDPSQFLDMENPLKTEVLKPQEAGEVKQEKHRVAYKNWCLKHNLDFEKAWNLRQNIIKYLVNKS